MITATQVKAKTLKRFWNKIKFEKPNECWEWNAGFNGKGYGAFIFFKDGKWKTGDAHRYLYIELFGELESGICVLHNCPKGDNVKCVNPNHMWLGTNDDNAKDRVKKGTGYIPSGSKNINAKLIEPQVVEIRKLLMEGRTQQYIGDKFGICRSQISMIKIGKAWTHVQM